MNTLLAPLLTIPIATVAVVAIAVSVFMGVLYTLTELIYEQFGFNPF